MTGIENSAPRWIELDDIELLAPRDLGETTMLHDLQLVEPGAQRTEP